MLILADDREGSCLTSTPPCQFLSGFVLPKLRLPRYSTLDCGAGKTVFFQISSTIELWLPLVGSLSGSGMPACEASNFLERNGSQATGGLSLCLHQSTHLNVIEICLGHCRLLIIITSCCKDRIQYSHYKLRTTNQILPGK